MGDVVYEGDIVRQTGRLLENIGALLKDGDATMNDYPPWHLPPRR